MRWFSPEDASEPIITAQAHIQSSHGNRRTPSLPETCVIFEIGMALPYIESRFDTAPRIEKLPCFLDNPRCVCLRENPSVCFTRGGYGAPAAVDTLETLRALGVKTAIVAGMCGVFAEPCQVGDVIVPEKILSEEGTSRHYFEQPDFAWPDARLHEKAAAFFARNHRLHTSATVTTDAVYRQTFYKEQRWREMGCVGVDMEASALLAVSNYYGMRAVAILLASDKHPVSGADARWGWGGVDFDAARRRFVEDVVAFAGTLGSAPDPGQGTY